MEWNITLQQKKMKSIVLMMMVLKLSSLILSFPQADGTRVILLQILRQESYIYGILVDKYVLEMLLHQTTRVETKLMKRKDLLSMILQPILLR